MTKAPNLGRIRGMRKLARRLAPWPAVSLLIGCASVQVSHDYDPGRDFSALKTYGWAPDSPLEKANQLAARRVMRAVGRELGARGLLEAKEKPDFLVVLQGGREPRLDVIDWGPDYPFPARYRGDPWWGYWGPRRVEVRRYDESVLVIDFIDAVTGDLIWRGTAVGVLGSAGDPEESERRVGEAVGKVLAPFPPGGK